MSSEPAASIWDWVDAPEPETDLSGERVTAVVVTHESAPWLGRTLASLRALEVAPARLLAVDNGSGDETTDLLADAVDEGLIDAAFAGDPRYGFGRAVAEGLSSDRGPEVSERPPAREWLWLLHDDIEVRPDTLRRLLEHAVADPGAAVLGPKLVQPNRSGQPRRIAELGETVAASGRRVPVTEAGEVDQGQRDRPEEVLAVSACGMLVRRDVWDALDGLDPEVPAFRDGLDFGWRATEAGYRVLTSPSAEIAHRSAGRSGLRARPLAADPLRLDRLLGMRIAAAHRHGVRAWFGALVTVFAGVLAALGLALGKAGPAALAELAAVRGFLGSRRVIARLRRRADGRATEAGRRRAAELRPRWWQWFAMAAERVAVAAAELGRSLREHGDDEEAASLDQLTGDQFATIAEHRRRIWHSPTLFGLLVALVVAALSARGLIRPGALTGPMLLPAHPGLGGAYASYLEPIVGDAQAWSAPWVGLAALAATVTFASPQALVLLLVAGVTPLAYLTASLAGRSLLASSQLGDASAAWLRTVLALGYGLLPVVLGAVGRGDLQALGLAVIAPVLAHAVHRFWVADDPAGAWRAAWRVALGALVVIALLPAAGLLVGAAVVGVAAVRRDRWAPAAVAALAGWALCLPWLPTLVRWPGRLLTGPDPELAPQAAASSLAMLAGRTPGEGLAPLPVSVLLAVLLIGGALAASALRPSDPVVLAGLGAALLAYAGAVLGSHQMVAVGPLGQQARPSATGWLVLTGCALFVVVARGLADAGPRPAALRGPGRTRRVAGAVAALAVLVAAVTSIAGADRPLERGRPAALAPFVLKAETSPARTRALIIDLSTERPRWLLSADGGTRLGDLERGGALGGSAAAQERLRELVARVAGGSSDAALAGDLAGLGIGHLSVRGANPEQSVGIENSPGMGVGVQDRGAQIWTVAPTGARAVVLQDGARTAVGEAVPPGPDGRTLLLGEPADPRWRAELDGVPLAAVDAGWQQGFALPGSGGRLSVHYAAPLRGWLAGLQLLGLAVLIVLAAPALGRADGAAQTARRGGGLR